MSDYAAVAGTVAGAISLVAYIPFIYAILRGKAKPNRASWIIWAVVSGIISVSYYLSGARETILVPICYTVGSSIIALLSLKYGEGGWTKFDRRCLAGAAISLVLWFVLNSPLIALLMNITIDCIGALPTIRKTYLNPRSEDRLTWTLFFAGSVVNVFAIKPWQFIIALYPVTMVLIIAIITVLAFRPAKTNIA